MKEQNKNFAKPMFKEDALSDKIIVVTGGGTGLGKAMATYFSEIGAKVAIASRKLDVLEKTANEISSKSGGEVLPVQCDVTNYEDVEKMFSTVKNSLGSANVLVNNAAGNFISPTERLSHRAFDKIVDIVLRGSYNCTLAFGKEKIEEKLPGNILNIITTYAWTGSAFVVPSAVSKGGVLAMTRSLAVEWAKYGIRTNAIAPGPFPTKGAWDRLVPKEYQEKFDFSKKVPLRRVGEHQELANLAAYLVSDFSAYINGEVITIDGGEWLQGAGQFNLLQMIPPEMWDNIEQQIRSLKEKK